MLKFIKNFFTKIFLKKIDSKNSAFPLCCIEYDEENHTWTYWI